MVGQWTPRRNLYNDNEQSSIEETVTTDVDSLRQELRKPIEEINNNIESFNMVL